MKKRMISLLLFVGLWTAMLPTVFAGAPQMEDCVSPDRIFAGCKSLYLALEGSYDSVVRCDYNALSIGFMQWHGSRALQLLKRICKADSALACSTLGSSLYNQVVKAADTGWSNYVPTVLEAENIRRLLRTNVGKSCQDSMAREDILAEARHGWNCGVRSEAGLIYYCSMENQYGIGGVQTVMRYVRQALQDYWGLGASEPITTLELLHSAVKKAGESHSYIRNYLSARNRVYDQLVNVQHLSPNGDADAVTGFVDLNDLDAPCYEAVCWAFTASPQIVNGVDTTHFCPDMPLSRAMAVTILWRAMGEPEPDCSEQPFIDVEPESYYSDAVLWAVHEGITVGTDATHFTPERACTRGEIITLLYRCQGAPVPIEGAWNFTDVEETDYYYKPICWAVQNGIASGVSATEFQPEASSPRVDIVLFLFRAVTGRAA
ncbi:MAG: S-layer homology domain-containing protein [Oscillospiraceae bacterium]|nr:S-layer homology domain-containing protein [Oscillospiraceae bacterium]